MDIAKKDNIDTAPSLYTDNISLTKSAEGVTLNVVQKIGESKKAYVISQIGMSKSKAKKLIKEVNTLLVNKKKKTKKMKGKNYKDLLD